VRLSRFRKHLVQVAALNRETWEHIRAETDDDHDWLPNPKQTGVLGLPVRGRMIDAWLALMAQLEALLEGKRTIPRAFLDRDGKGLNLKALLDDPPEKLVLDKDFPKVCRTSISPTTRTWTSRSWSGSGSCLATPPPWPTSPGSINTVAVCGVMSG